MTTHATPRILQIGRLPLPALETELAARYSVACLADQADPQGFLAAHGAEFSGVVTTASIGLTGEVIAALPRLQVISSFGVGFDALDIGAATTRGVPGSPASRRPSPVSKRSSTSSRRSRISPAR